LGEGLWSRGLAISSDGSVREEGVRKVTGGTARPNIAMARIMEQSDMHLEAIRVNQELIDGILVDLLYYARFA